MTLTETPRAQNDNILDYATRLAKLIKSGQLEQRAGDAERLIHRLTETFDAHVDEENRHLLPYLFQHPNERLRKTARRSYNRLTQVTPKIHHWSQTWHARRIETRPDEFHRDTQQVFMQLKAHIDGENRELFPLIEMET